MSTLRDPDPGLLFFSLLAARWDGFWPGLLEDMAARFGPASFVSEPFPFDRTTYYDGELGTPILRRVVAFDRLIPLDAMPDIKLWAMEVEARLSHGGRRTLNLDPGYVTLERVMLATGKNFTHRLYLGKRIWGDLTLIFQRNRWVVLPWTFPDYAADPMLGMLTTLRSRFQDLLARHKDPTGDGVRKPDAEESNG
ncbi:MAG: DUF4416 family protein [Desulfovibrionaceae bacterium]